MSTSTPHQHDGSTTARNTASVASSGPAHGHRDTLTVRVADRRHSPVGNATIRTITIAATCPTCAGPRGIPCSYQFHDDGEWLTCDRWDNPCGHIDMYDAVLAEAERATSAH